MKYRIRDILNFVESASCRTLMEAAQKLEISQPALSESILRLEADALTILFYRSRSGIQLTPSGKDFLMKAQKVCQSLEELNLNQELNIFSHTKIVIGCHSTVGQYSLPKALSYIKQKAPLYKIELKHDLSRNIQNEVQKGHIDIGIVINAVEVPDLVIQKLSLDEVTVWVANKSEKLDTVICNTQMFQVQSILKKWKIKPEKIINTDSLELICHLVDENIGYGIIPERAVILSGKNLKKVKEAPIYKDEISLVYRPEFGKTAAEKLVIESLKKSILSMK